MKPRPSRRDFLVTSALAGTSLWLPASARRRRSGRRAAANDKLNIAVIGCGGKGYSDMRACAGENIVALCDVDAERAAKAFEENPRARKYHDFRPMLDREKDLDAVVISTPDHVHAVAAIAAMQRGLHVFCQKPLTHSVEEARVLRELAAQKGVATQMGNQGTASDGLRQGVEVVQSGAVGPVREVHVWTNRPIWPQGIERPAKIEPIPATFRWDLWLGPAPYRPYNSAYAPFRWRGFWDFGTGALGDMACHIMNLPYLALRLGAPSSVEAECGPFTDDSPPKWSVIRYRFPARGELPPATLTWYDGDKKPPAELLPPLPGGDARQYSSGGSLMVGEKGSLYSTDDYGTEWQLLPEAEFADYEPPAPTLPRSPGIHAEWLEACKGGPRPMSSFAHAGPFTETVLLGNVALRCGRKIEWDAAAMRIENHREAERFLRNEYSWGYSIGG